VVTAGAGAGLRSIPRLVRRFKTRLKPSHKARICRNLQLYACSHAESQDSGLTDTS
jgi:hypothetical protein